MNGNGTVPPLAAWRLARLFADKPAPNGSALAAPWSEIVDDLAATSKGERQARLQAYLRARGLDVGAVEQAILEANPDGAEPEGERPRYVLHTADEAFDLPEEVEPLIGELVIRRSTNLVFGEPGSKKTYGLIDAAVCFALGQPWLGFLTPEGGGRVLIIDEESGNARLKRRLAATIRGHGAGRGLPIVYTSLAGFNLREAVDVGYLRSLVAQVQPDLVIIDALVDICLGGDENSVKDVAPVMHALRDISEAFNLGTIVIHHAGRSGKYRGSSSIPGGLDLMLSVESKAESPNIDFEAVKTRDGEPFKFSATAEFDKENDTFRLVATGSTARRGQKFTRAQKYVVRYLRNAGCKASKADIEGAADVCSAGTARNAIYQLAEMGILTRCDDGGRGSDAAYQIAPWRISEVLGDE